MVGTLEGIRPEQARQMLRYLRLPLMRFTEDLRLGDPPLRVDGNPSASDDLVQMLRGLDGGGWDIGKVRRMSTEDILEGLGSLGVGLDEARFRELASEHWSSIVLADEELLPLVLGADVDDEDFIWMSSYVLWERLVPGWQSVEQLDDAMQDGYGSLERGDLAGAMERWGEAWTLVKALVEPSVTSVQEADDSLPVKITQSIFNWCQDYRRDLHDASLEDPLRVEEMARFAREFLTRFPDTGGDILPAMRLAEATAHAMMGDLEGSEALFGTLVDDHPESAWPLIEWGDAYWMHRHPLGRTPSSRDYERAEDLYRRAWESHPGSRGLIEARLGDLRRTRERHERAKDRVPP